MLVEKVRRSSLRSCARTALKQCESGRMRGKAKSDSPQRCIRRCSDQERIEWLLRMKGLRCPVAVLVSSLDVSWFTKGKHARDKECGDQVEVPSNVPRLNFVAATLVNSEYDPIRASAIFRANTALACELIIHDESHQTATRTLEWTAIFIERAF